MGANVRPSSVVRWIGRLLSVLSIGTLSLFIFGEGAPWSSGFRLESFVAFLIFPTGVMIGMALAWWKEGLGATVTLACGLGIYLYFYATRGELMRAPAFLYFASPGFFFALSAWMRRRRSDPS